MIILGTRASPMTSAQALLTVYTDYMGGSNANYHQFAPQLDLDDAIGQQNNPRMCASIYRVLQCF